jgi:hypothetical protein
MVFMPAFQARLLTEIYVRLYSTYYHSTVVRFSGQRIARQFRRLTAEIRQIFQR